MEERLARIEDAVIRIEQALKGYNGHGGLIRDVERAHQRIDDLEKRFGKLEGRSWIVEGARTLVAGLAGLFGGRMG